MAERALASARHEQLVAVGADGVRGGWAVAACHVAVDEWARACAAGELPPPAARRTRVARCENIAAIARLRAGTEAVVGIDVPIGLSEHGAARACDSEARRLLGRASSSVFNPPARYLFEALDEPTAAERWHKATRLVAEHRGRHPGEEVPGVSRQTIGILDKVAEADRYLLAHPGAEDWLVECHPEVSFLRLNQDVHLAPKSTASGSVQRLELVERELPDARSTLREGSLAESLPLVDLLDAHAALWTALRVASGAVDPERDALGAGPDGRCPCDGVLPMRIVA